MTASPPGAKLDRIIWGFREAYRRLPRVYDTFSWAQDPDDLVSAAIIDGLPSSARATAWEVGAGTGRHAIGLAPFFHRYVALEPSARMLRLLAGLKIPNVEHRLGAFPEAIEEEGIQTASLLAFWADVPVDEFVSFSNRVAPACAAWVMNADSGPFAELWPRGARTAWCARAEVLVKAGFSCHPIRSRLAFRNSHELTRVLGVLFGDLPVHLRGVSALDFNAWIFLKVNTGL